VDLDTEIEEFKTRAPNISAKFSEFFIKEYLCDAWKYTWIDLSRPSRDGLWNTNKYSEALFRTIGRSFFESKSTLLDISDMMLVLLDKAIPYYDLRLQQKELGFISIKAHRHEKEIEKIHSKGLNLFLIGAVKGPESPDSKNFFCHNAQMDKLYVVNLEGRMSCSCPYWRWHGKVCKHIYAAILFCQEDNSQRSSTHSNSTSESIKKIKCDLESSGDEDTVSVEGLRIDVTDQIDQEVLFQQILSEDRNQKVHPAVPPSDKQNQGSICRYFKALSSGDISIGKRKRQPKSFDL